jgi:FtsZ-binding cell division protein ZapB
MSQNLEIENTQNENNEIENLKKEYEENLQQAVANYKNARAKLEFAFDTFEEECIKEEMDGFRKEVKSLRFKIDTLF